MLTVSVITGIRGGSAVLQVVRRCSTLEEGVRAIETWCGLPVLPDIPTAEQDVVLRTEQVGTTIATELRFLRTPESRYVRIQLHACTNTAGLMDGPLRTWDWQGGIEIPQAVMDIAALHGMTNRTAPELEPI